MDNTAHAIMETLERWAREKRPISAQEWMDAASKLNVLLQGEQELKFTMENSLAKMKAELLTNGQTSAAAKTYIEASEGWLLYKKQSSFVDRVLETIRIAKKNATLASDLMRSNID